MFSIVIFYLNLVVGMNVLVHLIRASTTTELFWCLFQNQSLVLKGSTNEETLTWKEHLMQIKAGNQQQQEINVKNYIV